jgi:hypothetical protein
MQFPPRRLPALLVGALLALLPQQSHVARAASASRGGSSAARDGAAADGDLSPVKKVLDMLGDFDAKGRQEKHDEQVAFGEFKFYCESTMSMKGKVISAAADEIESLKADILKAEADSSKLSSEVSALDSDLAAWAAEAKTAKALNEKERAEFEATDADYAESIDALERAIQVLKARSADVPQTALLELPEVRRALLAPGRASSTVAAGTKNEAPHRVLESLLQEEEASAREGTEGAPEVAAYEFQSSAVIDMLDKLRGRFIEERRMLEDDEMNRRHNYELLAQSLTDSTRNGEDTRRGKFEAKAKRDKAAAEGKGALAEALAGKEVDEKYLEDLKLNCQTKSSEFEARQKLRAEELEAIVKVIRIISSPEVAGAAEAHLPAAAVLLETQSQGRRALVQVRRTDEAAEAPSQAQGQVSSYLASRAQKLQSVFLASVAARVAQGPFEKVKKMIKDLLVKLMEEANDEADHKGWCDTELSTNKMSRANLNTEIESLTSEADALTALVGKLTEEIGGLVDAIAGIDDAAKKATKVRMEEKATNTATVQDAAAAQAALEQALKILKDFYGKAGEATALIQQRRMLQRQDPESDAPPTWGDSYKGMQSGKFGIVSMLQVIQSDFASVEASTNTAESEAQREYDTFMEDSELDKAVKQKEMSHKTNKKDSSERTLRATKKQLEATQSDYSAALDYYEKLKPSCVDTGVSYDVRVKSREEEIRSLTEALKILGGGAQELEAAADGVVVREYNRG